MESDLEEEKSKKAYLDKIRENYIRFMEDSSREKLDPAIYRNDGGAKKREEEAEMNMLRRRRERLMRRRERLMRRRRQREMQKQSKPEEEEEESFTSCDSDVEMNISLEEVKRLMENMNSTLTSKEEDRGDAVKIEEDSKAKEEEMSIADDDENMFPRTRGRLVRYLRRQRSKPPASSAFQIEFHHLQLPSDDE
ncbi:unnamed protein product [Eruca vesicaria subsp. sativa]|uniref:Uncharacterized protein n=1 Tax=Eruca vesicaria subsp. sativa TaxID=29727 RepID=A0ABC8KP85_ERUVS|nr:unnamed protein product [Eruca vesicaria subsp. sativa]